MAEEIQFGVFTAEDIVNYSVCEIFHNAAFTRQGQVCENGPCDLRLGAFDRYPCKTCHRTQECPGHFGHIALCMPMYNVNFLREVVKILDTLCLKCCRIKLAETEQLSWKRKSLDSIRAAVGGRVTCPHCNMQGPNISQSGAYIMMTVKGGRGSQEYLHADRVYDIFASIPENEAALFNFSNYDATDLLFTNLPVLPNTERPTFDKFDSGHQRSVDKLTYKLREIVMLNKKLAGVTEKRQSRAQVEPQILLLQDAITHFYTNAYMKHSFTLQRNIGAAYKRGTLSDGAPLHARLKGKGGQLRSNLMGKRVDMTARTVIVGDPALDLNQVRVPKKICMNLTVPERVTDFNRERLQDLVDAGPTQLIGANAVIRANADADERPDVFDLRFSDDIILLRDDIVERHLQMDDYIMFNRQPTLHRMSFMAMKVVPGDGNAFGMNVCA